MNFGDEDRHILAVVHLKQGQTVHRSKEVERGGKQTMTKRKSEEKQKYYNQLPFNTIRRQSCPFEAAYILQTDRKLATNVFCLTISGPRFFRYRKDREGGGFHPPFDFSEN